MEIAETGTGGASGCSLMIAGATVGGSLAFINAAEHDAPKTLDWDHWKFMHTGSGGILITLEAATLAVNVAA
ncbi:hypothetical protein ABZ490_40675 [Streptomyces sp. NPDC005811]|uniref:hypothetical protein n=1 Tax=Streptomyces sp. NPDC005811 TaxID=3154565 RepID=UPI0033E06D22